MRLGVSRLLTCSGDDSESFFVLDESRLLRDADRSLRDFECFCESDDEDEDGVSAPADVDFAPFFRVESYSLGWFNNSRGSMTSFTDLWLPFCGGTAVLEFVVDFFKG